MTSAPGAAAVGTRHRRPGIAPEFSDWLARLPWWLLVTILLGLLILYSIMSDEKTGNAFRAIVPGIVVTLRTAMLGYSIALVIGLFAGLGRTAQNPVISNITSFYVEIVRGIPILVLLLYVAFVGVPLMMNELNQLGSLTGNLWLSKLTPRSFPNEWRGGLALGFAYGAF